MRDQSPRYNPNNQQTPPAPEIPPPPGDLPKKFPESQPLSDDGLEAAKKESASTMSSPSHSHSGEDETVESGVPESDPEQPQKADGEEPL